MQDVQLSRIEILTQADGNHTADCQHQQQGDNQHIALGCGNALAGIGGSQQVRHGTVGNMVCHQLYRYNHGIYHGQGKHQHAIQVIDNKSGKGIGIICHTQDGHCLWKGFGQAD